VETSFAKVADWLLTGRNQPSNTKFIFGPGSWLRGLIKPKEGYGIAYMDYSQQEFAIAAALATRTCRKPICRAGAVPEGATKKTHPEQRL
jgi:DNA polymerase I